MTLDVNAAQREFDDATAGFHEQEVRRQLAAIRLIASHALAVAPEATHMLMESSDQGACLSVPSFLTVGEEHVAEEAWDARLEEFGDGDLTYAPSWLPWGSDRPDSDGWGQFVDNDHPYTNRRSGRYAIDLRRIVPSVDKPMAGWTHPDHLPGITVTTWDSDAGDGAHDGALVVQVDTDEHASQRRVRINLNDAPVWDGIADTDERPGQFFER